MIYSTVCVMRKDKTFSLCCQGKLWIYDMILLKNIHSVEKVFRNKIVCALSQFHETRPWLSAVEARGQVHQYTKVAEMVGYGPFRAPVQRKQTY